MNIELNKYKTFFFLLMMSIFVLILPKGFAQESIRIMAYNMSNYNTGTTRNSDFISVIGSIEPDIYTAVEINSTAGAENCRDNVLNQIGYGTYAMGYISGSYNNNAIYYRSDKFNLVSATKLIGGSGDPKTCEFILTHTSTGRQFVIFGVHAPAGSDAERLAHVDAIRNITDAYTNGEYFIAAGDFNIDDATENSYNALVDDASSGYFIDPEGYGDALLKTHNNTKSTWYRHDLILNSQSIVNSGGIEYVTGSFTVPGNIDGSSASVPQVYKDASNHLPVYADYLFYDIETPVELTTFTGVLNGDHIDLHWKTETEVNNYGFYIESRTDNSEWITVGFVEGHGNSNSPKEYNFVDTHINKPDTYYYRLKQIDNDGTSEYFNVVSVDVGILNEFYLTQNYPNPFNPETRIEFTVPEKQLVSLRIYNMLGELVEELIDGEKETGSYSIIFDGSNLPSGVYYYKLQTSSFTANKKMLLIK